MASAEISSAKGTSGAERFQAGGDEAMMGMYTAKTVRSRYNNNEMVASGLDLDPAIGALLGDTTTEIDVARKNRVFCNRNLRMDSIEMIGFDMDYTLALYHQDKLEQLSISLTLDKLIGKHGYPDAIRALTYDPRWAIRGLMVDRQLGNVFKMDRHAHVGRCYHGKRELDHDQRKATYR